MKPYYVGNIRLSLAVREEREEKFSCAFATDFDGITANDIEKLLDHYENKWGKQVDFLLSKFIKDMYPVSVNVNMSMTVIPFMNKKSKRRALKLTSKRKDSEELGMSTIMIGSLVQDAFDELRETFRRHIDILDNFMYAGVDVEGADSLFDMA